ncbi:iron-sulfur cluster repair di-iron protein [Virgibacillus xinjiangensis]|uniref:Iron-sulfur cluster repair di-iron protein n=1 Tax=Virgibacillus xinjiangensis TaxID=393090 RepID=A0ABV7CWL8_9BACI
MNTFTVEHTPANIVKVFPKASDLFKVHQIDFCCGGHRPLKESFEEKNLDEQSILSELNQAFTRWQEEGNQATDWDTASLTELVDHIVHRHHAYLMEELPALGQFVTKIYRKHGENQPHLKELHKLYGKFMTEMEEHTIKEENDVFPLIKEYEQNPSDALIRQIHEANGELESEHDEVGKLLKEMRRITDGFKPHANACGSYQITYARLKELEDNTFQHIHLENNILFPRI